MPLSAFSSSSLGLPPLGETGACGTNGLSFFHNAALISLFFFMPCQTSARRFSMTGFVSGSYIHHLVILCLAAAAPDHLA
jgi:hypothetical protein